MLRGSNALPWLGFWIRLGAAAVWIIAGAAKIPQIQAFQVLVQRYGMLPDVFSGPFAYILPFLEVAIGLVPRRRAVCTGNAPLRGLSFLPCS